MKKQLASIMLSVCSYRNWELKKTNKYPKPPEGFEDWSSVISDLVTEIRNLQDTLIEIKNTALVGIQHGETYQMIVDIVDEIMEEENG